MGSHAERLLHPRATTATVLRGEAGRDGYHRDAMQQAIVADPAEETVPADIADTFGKVMILDQMGYLVGRRVSHLTRPLQNRACDFRRTRLLNQMVLVRDALVRSGLVGAVLGRFLVMAVPME